MLFVPKIDLNEYCDPYGNYTEAGINKLLKYSDRFYEEYDKRKEQEKKDHTEICKKINNLLNSSDNDSYKTINEIINSHGYQNLCGAFFDLTVFRSSYAIYQIEKEMSVFPTIYDVVTSIDDYFDLRMQTLYCFRRIQLHSPLNDTENKFCVLLNRRVSLFYLVQMLRDITVGDKGFIGIRIAELYELHGMTAEAAIIRNHIVKNYGLTEWDNGYDTNPKENVVQNSEATVPFASNKILCFVTCVNNEIMYEECLYYISRLKVPGGYRIITKAVRDAESMASGYNTALNENEEEPNIIIYLHQDVCILNPYFLFEIIRIFDEENNIGMIGMIGSPVLPPDGIMWNGKRTGNLYSVQPDNLHYIRPAEYSKKEYEIVEAVDGFLMVTNRSIRWREDIFDGWDFYDISQCAEYRNRGLKIVVPMQDSPWAAHDDGIINIYDYNKYRKLYLNEYRIT